MPDRMRETMPETPSPNLSMHLRVNLPSGVVVDEDVVKVVAEAPNGHFCLLPRHVDFVAALVPGILAFILPAKEATAGTEQFLAIDEGMLVKRGQQVLVSTWNAVKGPLGQLKQAVNQQFRELSDREQLARLALNRIESSLVKQILEWEERGHA